MRRTLRVLIQLALAFLAGYALFEQLSRDPKDRTWRGDVFNVPYDFRPPTVDRVMERWWNPNDERVLTPHVFGVGWSINLYQLKRRGLGLFA
jgi:hypothetical protein